MVYPFHRQHIAQIPAIELYQKPTTEPVSVFEAQTYIRTEGDAEYNLIEQMLLSARTSAERYMRLSIMTQKWKITYGNEAPQEVKLYSGPATAIDSVKLVDKQGTETIFDPLNYYISADQKYLVFEQTPSAHKIEIIYTAGIATDASEVPETIKQGILAHTAHLYERGAEATTGKAAVSDEAKSFLNIYRKISL